MIEKIETIAAVFNDRHENLRTRVEFPDDFGNTFRQTIVVKVEGSLDTENSQDFYCFACDVVEASTFFSEIRLDLAGLEYVSTTGIGALVSIFSFSRQEDVELTIVNMNGKIRSLIDALGLTPFIKVMGAA